MAYNTRIPIPGTEKYLYGIYEGDDSAPLVVLAHGFTGNVLEQHLFNGARALQSAGFATFLLAFYSDQTDARNLIDCTIDDHAADLDLVVRTFHETSFARPISVIGHSLGGLVILHSRDRAFDAAVLWDPTHSTRGNFDNRPDIRWEPALNCWRVEWGVDILASDAFARSWRKMPSEELIADLRVPIKIIIAGDGVHVATSHSQYEAANEPKAVEVIDGADHAFSAGSTDQRLYEETLAWLEKHGRAT